MEPIITNSSSERYYQSRMKAIDIEFYINVRLAGYRQSPITISLIENLRLFLKETEEMFNCNLFAYYDKTERHLKILLHRFIHYPHNGVYIFDVYPELDPNISF